MTRIMLSFVIRYSGSRGWFTLGLVSLAAWVLFALAGGGTTFVRSNFLLISMPLGILARLAAQWADFIVSDKTLHHSEILTELLEEPDEKIVLILRQFGNDGEILMPRGRRHAPRNSVFAKFCSLEQVITISCEQQFDAIVVSIVDQKRRYAPPGPLSVRAGNHDWQQVVEKLIAAAHAIFIIASPQAAAATRKGLKWELEVIRRLHRQSCTSIVLPPYDQDANPYDNAFGNARRILATLGDEDPDLRCAGRDRRTILLQTNPAMGTRVFNGKRGTKVNSEDYARCIEAGVTGDGPLAPAPE